MSFCVKKIVQFSQSEMECIPQFDNGATGDNSLQLLGGVLHDNRYVWQAKGPLLEVRNTKTGSKVGAWVFGGILKDSNTRIVCIEEILRPNGRISLLTVGIECTISGGIICIFDIFSSKVVRAIQIKEKISSLHVIDPGIEDLNLPGPLRNFDGILAAGTDGGNLILIDICRQICEESLHSSSKRDELNPSKLTLLTTKHIPKIEHYKERSVRDGNHLAIHLNAVFDSETEHFVLKGPKGDDRIHVNKEEVVTSAVYYCPQLTSLLVGYNFGAFQLWDLTTLKLVYTSPVCDEHFPITSFTLQEPTDDPRAFCYIWAAYSNTELYQTGLPFAVMYSLCYESKEYHEGYGYLYQDFHYCTIRFQVELGQLEEHRGGILPKGGRCLGFQPITKLSTSKESFSHSPAGDTLALCLVSWTIWYSKSDTQTCCLVFDLNQWYKEQMPNFTKWKNSNNYILQTSLSDLLYLNGHKGVPISNILMENKSISQFIGVQRLEEHFYPTSLSFNLWILRESDIILIHNQGLQKYLLSQIDSAGPLCLVRPTDVCRQAITVGLTPLFMDIHPNRALSTETQREILLNVALEHQLIGWLCKCASEWANGSFSSAGCSLDFIVTWAFQRALVLKTNCDKYCTPLFDYSHSRLDSNTSVLLNNCTRQINSLCVLYKHVVNKLGSYVGCLDLVKEHWTGLEMVSVYFEVLQWLVNVGLLPECHPSTYPRPDNLERISAPYPVQELSEYYNEKRAELRLLSKENFESNDSLLFIDNLIERKCGGGRLQKQWQEDGGSGLYPPPSLQSLIRTYLVDGAGISHKHSLVIYLFLDLAMALDQSKYSSVVTHLIKFPAVFKVSPSVIKITQAFWQLDHGDFTTAMEQLLDPFVLGEDLQPWHHAIAMRALLVHKQPNFALLYMQIRKPPITDEKDVLTAISLFIANNMLDEAFYFKKQHQNKNEEKLLAHLFHECSKNDTLHLVLYKCLNTDEEKYFFNYLKSVENPTSDDLQIFYYLLRSRFIEAFDTHSNIKRKCPERQGLIGQSMASKTDQIVKIFKTLLPDVNKNLVDYIRRERNNLWKEVQRPTPMSVFVHNTNEQVKYKSTLIHAALAKAKHTFHDNVNQSCHYNDLITEETPFLRTPAVRKNGKRTITPVITPKIIDFNESFDEVSAPPSKRRRLSPRTATNSPPSPLKSASKSITLTPIVKRKTSLVHDQSLSYSNMNVCTPQSILKVRHLVQRRESLTDEEIETQIRGDLSLQIPSLRLQPRSSLSQTPKHQHVQFDEATRFSSSLSDQSKLLDNTPLEDQILHKSSLSSKDVSSMISSSANEDASDDVFYSPDNSDHLVEENGEEEILTEGLKETQTVEDYLEVEREQAIETGGRDKGERDRNEEVESVNEKEIAIGNFKESSVEVTVGSPRARRSYKRPLGELSPTRSSPRLSKLQVTQQEEHINQDQSGSSHSIISEKTTTSNDSLSTDSLSPRPTRVVPKLKGRKSLSRKVLENNTFSKSLAPPPKDSLISKEHSFSKSEVTTITEKSLDASKISTVESNLTIVDTEEKGSSFQETPTTRKTHISSDFVTKRQHLEKTFDADTSEDSDLSFQYEEKEDSYMKLSDSLQEYVDFLMASGKKLRESEQFENKDGLPKVQLDFDEDMGRNKETQLEDQKLISNTEEEFEGDKQNVEDAQPRLVEQKLSSDIEKLLKNKEKNEETQVMLDLLVEELVEDNEQPISIEDSPIQVIDELNEAYQEAQNLSELEVNEPYREAQILSELTPVQIQEPLSGPAESVNVSYEQEQSYDELELNIFGLIGDEGTPLSKTKRGSVLTDTPVTDSYYLPKSDMAFIGGPLDESHELAADNSVVLISSSDDEVSSSSQHSSNSAYSKTTEEYCRRDENSYTSSKGSDVSENVEDRNADIVFQYEEQEIKGTDIEEDIVSFSITKDAMPIIDDSKDAPEEVELQEELTQSSYISEQQFGEGFTKEVETKVATNKIDVSEIITVEDPVSVNQNLNSIGVEITNRNEGEVHSSNEVKHLMKTTIEGEKLAQTVTVIVNTVVTEELSKVDQTFCKTNSRNEKKVAEPGKQLAYTTDKGTIEILENVTEPVARTIKTDQLTAKKSKQAEKSKEEFTLSNKSNNEKTKELPETDQSTNTAVTVNDKIKTDQTAEKYSKQAEKSKEEFILSKKSNTEETKELSETDQSTNTTVTIRDKIKPDQKKTRRGEEHSKKDEESKEGLIHPSQSNNKITKELPKIHQSTNTTVLVRAKTAKNKEEKVDQSTNTTVTIEDKMIEMSKKLGEKIHPVDNNVTGESNVIANTIKPEQEKHTFIEGTDRPQTRRKYSRPKKVTGDEQATSSSDTTEGETFRNETVVVQIHTPSMSNEKPENAPSKRAARKNSASALQVTDIDIKNAASETEETKKLIVDIERIDDLLSKNFRTQSKEDSKQPKSAKRTRRALSESDIPARTMSIRKVGNVNIDCDPNTSTEIIKDTTMVRLTLRNKRSASVNEVKTFSRQRTGKRSKSVDEDVREDSKERKAKSVMHMPVISEENMEDGMVKGVTKSRSVIDSYATARRLTRRQANMVKEVTIITDADSIEDLTKKQIDLEPIDPINLLEKELFEGKPDPDEKKVYEPSSPSSTTTSVLRRNSRSSSIISDISISPPQNLSVPKKNSRTTRSQTRSPVASGVSTRSRKQSETSSIVSEKSNSSTPPKISRKKKFDDDVESTVRSTRSRTASVSSVKSGKSSSKKVARAGKVVSAKSHLPEIVEEKVVENTDSTSTSSKRGKSEAKSRRKK